MKKLSLFFVLVLVATLLFGCNNSGSNNTNTTVGGGTAWSDTAVDKNLVGAWQVEGSSEDEIRVFTEDCKIRFVSGSAYMQGDVMYGIDTEGNHKYFSDFYYMAGELQYVVDSETAIFVRDDGVTQTLKKIDYTAPELTVYDNFNAENPLVGTWYNEEYKDAYTFNADGTATYEMNDTENVCLYHVDYTYREENGKIYLTCDAGEGVEESVSTYVITDGVLDIDGGGDYVKQ